MELTTEDLQTMLMGYQARHAELTGKIATIRTRMHAVELHQFPAKHYRGGALDKYKPALLEAIPAPLRAHYLSGDWPTEKPRRKMSAAGRRAISEAQKKRWAKQKRAQRQTV